MTTAKRPHPLDERRSRTPSGLPALQGGCTCPGLGCCSVSSLHCFFRSPPGLKQATGAAVGDPCLCFPPFPRLCNGSLPYAPGTSRILFREKNCPDDPLLTACRVD